MTARSAQLLFANIDPYFALFNFWTGEVALGAFIVLGIVILASFIIERPFCKYFCPYGALLGIFNLFRVFKIKRNSATCINCKACDKNCPMNIPLSTCSTSRNHQCITCMKCTSEQACPQEHTMELKVGKWGGK
jgi:polyferredoxin